MHNVHHTPSLIGDEKAALTCENIPDLTDVPGFVDRLELNLMCVTNGDRTRALAAFALLIDQEQLMADAYGADRPRRSLLAALSREVRSRQAWSGIAAGFGG